MTAGLFVRDRVSCQGGSSTADRPIDKSPIGRAQKDIVVVISAGSNRAEYQAMMAPRSRAARSRGWATFGVVAQMRPHQLGPLMKSVEDAINDSQWQVADNLLAKAQVLINSNTANVKTWQAELHVVRGYYFARRRDWDRAERELADAYILEPSNEGIKQASACIQGLIRR